MKAKNWIAAWFCCLAVVAGAQDKYVYEVDLNAVEDDRLTVTLTPPVPASETVEFHMPKIVPGTYSIYDFGRFVDDFQAFDEQGNEMLVKKLTENRWEIYSAPKLRKIVYKVDDTFDSDLDNKIFEPAGTNIEAGKNFVLNTFGLFGYLDGMDDMPYSINIGHPEDMYGASALVKAKETADWDEFTAPDYFELADSPIMYGAPDTVQIPVGNCQVLVSVYSPNGVLKADDIRTEVANIMDAQRQYLGGTLPVNRYAILIYLFSGFSNSGSAGALEHSYSTLFSLPEQGADQIAQTIRDVTAHEFFHIVTPLNIHSEHIHDYDFINPQMSKHLWLYEGVTEYSSQHVQVKYDLYTEKEFLDAMRQKMLVAGFYNDTLPFTQMSKGALDKYQAQYGNVYQKGALIGMCLDLLLLDLSDGQYNLQQLMRDLSRKFGKNQAFEDDRLFDIIAGLTYPEVKTFLETYVSGSTPLPYEELLAKVGVKYHAEKEMTSITLGNVQFGYDPETQRLVVNSLLNANDFARELGYAEGDQIVAINGVRMDEGSINERLDGLLDNIEEGDKIVVEVMRENGKGEWKSKKLKARAQSITKNEKHVLELDPDATERQKGVRSAWLDV